MAEKRSANLGYCGVPGIVKRYASGIAITMDKFDQQYGYFEAKIKVPKGNGLWPAFWMMPYHAWPPEIDIMEILGRDTDTMYMTNHWGTASSPQKNGDHFREPISRAIFMCSELGGHRRQLPGMLMACSDSVRQAAYQINRFL